MAPPVAPESVPEEEASDTPPSLEEVTEQVRRDPLNWIAEADPGERRVTAQIRHRHPAAPATARPLANACVEIEFDSPQIAITPGQALVMYDGDLVVGGGWID